VTPRERDRGQEGPPQEFGKTTPPIYQGADYSFTLQAVFEIQKAVGKLTEAVENLKSEAKQQGEKLDAVRNDVHAAKAVIRVVGAALILFFGFLGWVIYEALPLLRPHP
jgi:hypothetical protein